MRDLAKRVVVKERRANRSGFDTEAEPAFSPRVAAWN
jgi:hypothetical protein